jgi:glycosyltransferase involved in cell wall biosynthesis
MGNNTVQQYTTSTLNLVTQHSVYVMICSVHTVHLHMSTGELQGRLDYYLRMRLPPKVRLLRLTERTGLIRARLAGARAAVGNVLVFLDAHCEVVQNW